MAGGTKPLGLHNPKVNDEEDNSADQKCSAEELRQLKESEKKSTNSYYKGTKMRRAVIELSEKMERATKSFDEKKSESVASFNPMASPVCLDIVDYRHDNKRCIMEECNKLSDCMGLCQAHVRAVKKECSALELEFLQLHVKALVVSKRQARNAQLGESVVQDLHYAIANQLMSAYSFIDGDDGFFVAGGFALALEGEDPKSNAHELALLMNCSSVLQFVGKMGYRGFFMTDEDKKKYGNLQADESFPKGWDFRYGLRMHRKTTFRAGAAPDLGMSEEYKKKTNMLNAERKKRKILAENPSASVSPTKLVLPNIRMKGGATCQVPGCGKTQKDDYLVKKGRCSAHRTVKSHPPCSHPGCENWKKLTKGKCYLHKEKKICVVRGCNNQGNFAGQVCNKHRNN